MCPCCIEKLKRAFAVAAKHKAGRPARRPPLRATRMRPVGEWQERAGR